MNTTHALAALLGLLAAVPLGGAEPSRIAVLQLWHETVTFLPNDTTRDEGVRR